MRYQAFVRVAAGALATAVLGCGAAFAQGAHPTPKTMTDTAPLPASERQSIGAVIMMDEPVLAQRQAMAAVEDRSPDTTMLGAGPERAFRSAEMRQRERARRAQELQQQRRGTPK